MAKVPIELPPWETFEERASNVLAAKIEIDKTIEAKRLAGGWTGSFAIRGKDIRELEAEFGAEG